MKAAHGVLRWDCFGVVTVSLNISSTLMYSFMANFELAVTSRLVSSILLLKSVTFYYWKLCGSCTYTRFWFGATILNLFSLYACMAYVSTSNNFRKPCVLFLIYYARFCNKHHLQLIELILKHAYCMLRLI